MYLRGEDGLAVKQTHISVDDLLLLEKHGAQPKEDT